MLKHFLKNYHVDSDSLENSDILNKAKEKMGIKLYGMANRVFSEYVKSRDKSQSAGYFKFAFIIGDSGQASKRDVDYLWARMEEIYGNDEKSQDFIKRILGTVCMKCVAEDSRKWVYRDDMEKKLKQMFGETPDATEYWINE